MLKRHGSIGIMAVLILLLLPSCTAQVEQAPEALSGKWMLCGAVHDGVEYTLEQLADFGIQTVRSIHFLDAQQVVLALGLTDDTLEGATEYTFDGQTVDIPQAGMVLTLDGGRLFYQSGDVRQIFEREQD